MSPRENFFGVNYGTSYLLGAPASELESLVGDILVTQEVVPGDGSHYGLFRLHWDGTTLTGQKIPVSPTSAPVGQWEHVTMAPAGIVEIPPVD